MFLHHEEVISRNQHILAKFPYKLVSPRVKAFYLYFTDITQDASN